MKSLSAFLRGRLIADKIKEQFMYASRVGEVKNDLSCLLRMTYQLLLAGVFEVPLLSKLVHYFHNFQRLRKRHEMGLRLAFSETFHDGLGLISIAGPAVLPGMFKCFRLAVANGAGCFCSAEERAMNENCAFCSYDVCLRWCLDI